MELLILLIIVLIVVLIIIKIRKPFNLESFFYDSKLINVAILFTGYNIDEWDYEFVKTWNDDIKFYFIWNKDKKENANSHMWANKIKELPNVTTLERFNSGWDATAWRDCVVKYYDEITKYDEIFLINNSMNYEKLNMKQISELANQYDVYGIFYERDQSPHIDSYFTGFNHKTVNSNDFKQFFFYRFPKINTHMESVAKYEMNISKYFESKGYTFGSYIVTKRPHTSIYMIKPGDVNLNDVKITTKKAHLKVNNNYSKWKQLK